MVELVVLEDLAGQVAAGVGDVEVDRALGREQGKRAKKAVQVVIALGRRWDDIRREDTGRGGDERTVFARAERVVRDRCHCCEMSRTQTGDSPYVTSPVTDEKDRQSSPHEFLYQAYH